ncbi:hypothetical protein D0T50_00970 [Bacteroides sp. 214]|uniref:hypothetical protein n=1 Tax=Bacteroides sp. 214 TaxID=2302935 RepID=UPI0013D1B434|nr:hypothetical protein [Bacteroides sp. 214]NDW11460.1 hypothetical protein [Bacteroides sp. 214]
MGFLDNVTNEFGKKTGKAIGNKLYGRHADDVRLGQRVDANVNYGAANVKQSEPDYGAIEREKRITMQHEQDAKFLNAIINIQFNPQDKDAIITELTALSSYVDLWIKESNQNLNAAKSKFDAGLAMLRSIEPNNTMIAYFEGKKIEWQTFIEQQKKKKRTTILVIAGVLLVFVIVLIIFA